MKLAVRNSVLVVVAAVALIAGYFTSERLLAPEPAADVSALVDVALPDLKGKQHWISEWQGKLRVLNFWATWCGPCREEIPLLVRAQKRYRQEGLQVIGIAIDNRDSVAAFAKEMHIEYPLLLGEDAGLAIMSRYGNTRGYLPYTVIVGRNGAVLARKLGGYSEKELAQTINSLKTSERSGSGFNSGLVNAAPSATLSK